MIFWQKILITLSVLYFGFFTETFATRLKVDFDLDKFQRNQLEYNFTDQALGVVEVKGELSGTGIVILVDNTPYIITNSHIVGKVSSVVVRVPKQTVNLYKSIYDLQSEVLTSSELRKKGLFGPIGPVSSKELQLKQMVVELNIPLADLALVKLPDNASCKVTNLFKSMGFRNLRVVRPTESNPYGISLTSRKKDISSPVLLANIIKGQNRVLKSNSDYLPGYMADRYISGFYRRIIVASFFAYPGLSGGALYYLGELRGMLSKVTLGHNTLTFFVPVEEVAKLLVEYFYGHKISAAHMKKVDKIFVDYGTGFQISNTQNADSFIKKSASLEKFLEEDRTLSNSFLVVDGGGEIADGGIDIKNSSDRNKMWYMHFDTSIERSTKQVVNPFYFDEFKVEASPEKIIQIDNPTTPDVYYPATTCVLNWLKNFNRDRTFGMGMFKWRFRDYKWEWVSISRLNKARLNTASLKYPKFKRWYRKKSNGNYTFVVNHRMDMDNLYGMELFTKDHNRYFYAKKGNSVLNVLIFKDKFPGLKNDLKIYIPEDFSSIRLTATGSRREKTLLVPDIVKSDIYKTIFYADREDSPFYRGVVIYSSDNLAEIDRIFVETENYLFEFIACAPGLTCVR